MGISTSTGTLTAGQSRTFALAPGSALTLTLLPNCRVTVTETPETVSASDAGGNSPRTQNHQLAGVFTYGPYAMGGSVVVDNASNSGSTVTWGRKDTTVSTSSDGLSLVSGDGNSVIEGLNIRAKGAKSDGVALYDATSTASTSSVIGSVSAAFTTADVGKACVIIPYTDTGLTPRWGTIVSVDSATQVTTSLSASPGALTGATFIYGTDDGAALDLALAAAAALPHKGVVQLPLGITVTTLAHVVPSGVTLQGVCNNHSGGKAKDFKHYGSSLVAAKSLPSSPLVTLGTFGTSDPRGTTLRWLNVDAMNLTLNAVSGDGGRTPHVYNCTLVRGIQETYKGGPTTRLHNNCIIGQNAWNVVQLSGDSNCVDNIITGAGNGYYGIKLSNGDDILVMGNHIWKDSSASTMLGGSIWASWFSGLTYGSANICNNKCDTNYGSAIKVSVSGSSTRVRGLQINGNVCFNNDSVTNNTGPVIETTVADTCSIRGFVVQGNNARGSWNDQSKGQWSALMATTLTGTGAIYGSSVGGNVADNCNALFIGVTAWDHDNGNISIAGSGTTLAKSTTT